MTLLERIGLEILAGLVCSGGVWAWWAMHDRHEQKLGAQGCIISTTEVKSDIIRIDARDAIEQGIELTNLKGLYELQLSSDSAGNARIAQRVFNRPLCASAVPGAGSAAAVPAADPGLSEGQSAARLIAVLDACDANQARVEGLAAAYNDWRARMIRENGQQ